MSRKFMSGFENSSYYDSSVGAIGVIEQVATAPKSGSYHLRAYNASADSVGFGYFWAFSSSTHAVTHTYCRSYVRIVTSVSTSTPIIYLTNGSGGATDTTGIVLNTDNTLTLQYNNTGAGSTNVSGNSIPLDSNTWYRVEVCQIWVNATDAYIEARIEGQPFASTTATNIVQNDPGSLWIGIDPTEDGIPATGEVYFDDIAVNDNSGSYENSWCRGGDIVALEPNVAGDINTFATQIGGTAGAANNFSRVVLPNDGAATYNGSIVLNESDMFNITSPTIARPVKFISVIIIGGSDIFLGTSRFKAQLKATSGGTTLQSADAQLPSTMYGFIGSPDASNYSIQPILSCYLDPTGKYWTSETLSTMQVGYIATVAGTNQLRVSTVTVEVEFAEPRRALTFNRLRPYPFSPGLAR